MLNIYCFRYVHGLDLSAENQKRQERAKPVANPENAVFEPCVTAAKLGLLVKQVYVAKVGRHIAPLRNALNLPTMNAALNSDDSLLPGPMLIVEDDPLMQARLRDLLVSLGYAREALTFASSIAQAKALLDEHPIAMALVDVGLPDGNGIDLIRVLHQRDPTLPILVISTWNTEQVVVTALQAGATGYLLKERDEAEISMSIRSALRGGAPIDPFVAKRILELIGTGGTLLAHQKPSAPRDSVASPLSGREIEILSLVSKGLTNREIADVLSLSKLTVGCHIRNIYKKLAVNSRTQAIFEARSNGWLP